MVGNNTSISLPEVETLSKSMAMSELLSDLLAGEPSGEPVHSFLPQGGHRVNGGEEWSPKRLIGVQGEPGLAHQGAGTDENREQGDAKYFRGCKRRGTAFFLGVRAETAESFRQALWRDIFITRHRQHGHL